jgi:hypothetical protein
MTDPIEQKQQFGWTIIEGSDGYYTDLVFRVRTEHAPDISQVNRWLSQIARATQSKIGASPIPIPPPRPRKQLPKPEGGTPVYWNGDTAPA